MKKSRKELRKQKKKEAKKKGRNVKWVSICYKEGCVGG